jgi:hypothetical protein
MNENVVFTFPKDTAVNFLHFLNQLPTYMGVHPIVQFMVAQFNEQQEKKDEPANDSQDQAA